VSTIPTQRPILKSDGPVVDKGMTEMDQGVDGKHSTAGHTSTPPKQLISAFFLQLFFTLRSECQNKLAP